MQSTSKLGVRSLFETLVDPDHLDHAARFTVRGKRRRPDVAWFLYDREPLLSGSPSVLTWSLACLLRGRASPRAVVWHNEAVGYQLCLPPGVGWPTTGLLRRKESFKRHSGSQCRSP